MRLLNIFLDTILPITIIIVAIIGSIFLYNAMRKKFNKPYDPTIRHNVKPQVSINPHYCTEKEMKFLDALHKALPRDCISFPIVGVSRLIIPKNNLIDYKSVQDKFVDICVFLRKEMKPILVIDLYETSPATQQFKKFDDDVNAVLKEVKIPVLHKKVEDKYSIENLRIEVLQAMENSTVAYLKDTTINSIK